MLDLNNSALWNFFWSANVQAELVQNKPRYLPIPPVEVPFLLDNHIIAVQLVSSTAPPSWKFAAFLSQKISTGILVGGSPETQVFEQKIYLNRISLLTLPKLTTTYSISFNIPYWFYDMSLKLWTYTGEENASIPTNDYLEGITESLLDIDRKLERIRRELN